ncbi:6172_t:CDS:2 [Scutellospora calospora]|uniref:6172_t:CDS:1 n=1 Tax=Scutellospora calospora TaxID=85575 RepID=A0ACA9K2X7_9GLOM|nr:6172_t:CDS:2 [Scutellospora calospora]
MSREVATFAAGCFWGVEHIFRKHFKEIEARVCSKTTGHAEACRIEFDPTKINYATLVEFFYKTHDPTTLNKQGHDTGNQYRSAIFYYSPEQKKIAEEVTAKVQERLDNSKPGSLYSGSKIVTEIVEAGEWYDAEDYHQKYLVSAFSTTELSSMTVDASEHMSNDELGVDSGKIHVLKQQVHSLRHDLAEKNALLTTSTTGRVIENLHAEIDHLKKDLADSKTQIHVAKVSRERAERQVQEHLASHQTLRLEIDSLKRMLERKERQSKELEESAKEVEKKNSDMKFERDNANLKLRQSELKVSDLERKLQEALAGKEKAEYEYTLLSKEMQAFKTRYTKDVEIVKKEFKSLREEMNLTSRQLEDVVLMTSVRIEELNSERKDELGNLESIHTQLQDNQEKYATKLFNEIEAMKKDVETSNQKTKEYSEQVVKIKGEIAGKLNWLKRIERVQQKS